MLQALKTMLHEPKQRVALSSVIAAVFLIVLKLYVGIVTNSLGILSEALHSSLDFVAAVITMFAVVSASKPADLDHHFGHAKSENLSALLETVLLLATCVWIFAEAANRMIFAPQVVEANIFAFATMSISIVVDVSRSRVLYRAARKYKSQALEADALHFSSDILSSSIVIAGLVFVSLGLPLGDPLGAIGVGVLVLVASLRLGRRALDYLMDKAPAGMTDAIRRSIAGVEGVEITRIRLRSAGSSQFVDVKISLDRRLSLEASREVVSKVEAKIREVSADADIAVQVEPRTSPDEALSSKITLIASKSKGIRHVHNIAIQRVNGELALDIHVEVDPELTVGDAHELVTDFENKVKSQLGFKQIYTHIETHEAELNVKEDVTQDYPNLVKRVKEIVRRYPKIVDCHEISIRTIENKISVSMHCLIAADEPMAKAHELVTDLEKTLKDELMGLDSVVIHVEPKG
jgi:cation diffusion facilitator family transporter